jgi:hypothetical protein
MEDAIPWACARASSTLALLATVASASGYEKLAPEFAWQSPIPLPNSLQAVLLLGQR